MNVFKAQIAARIAARAAPPVTTINLGYFLHGMTILRRNWLSAPSCAAITPWLMQASEVRPGETPGERASEAIASAYSRPVRARRSFVSCLSELSMVSGPGIDHAAEMLSVPRQPRPGWSRCQGPRPLPGLPWRPHGSDDGQPTIDTQLRRDPGYPLRTPPCSCPRLQVSRGIHTPIWICAKPVSIKFPRFFSARHAGDQDRIADRSLARWHPPESIA